MNQSLILSNLRVELRRKQASYISEKTTVMWVKRFLKEMSIVHSSQLRSWQKEFFLSNLQKKHQAEYNEILQAKSALLFLYEKVLKPNGQSGTEEDTNHIPDVLRITA